LRRFIKGTGGRAIGITCDVCDEKQVAAAVSEPGKTSEIDILVNNAASSTRRGCYHAARRMEKKIGVILTGAFLFTKHAGPVDD